MREEIHSYNQYLRKFLDWEQAFQEYSDSQTLTGTGAQHLCDLANLEALWCWGTVKAKLIEARLPIPEEALHFSKASDVDVTLDDKPVRWVYLNRTFWLSRPNTSVESPVDYLDRAQKKFPESLQTQIEESKRRLDVASKNVLIDFAVTVPDLLHSLRIDTADPRGPDLLRLSQERCTDPLDFQEVLKEANRLVILLEK